MSLNHRLNYCLIKFLSNQNFISSEFKEIFYGFSSEHPEFFSSKYYQSIYRIVRNLVDCNLITFKRYRHVYKYTSNYTVGELENYLIKHGVRTDFKDELKNEFVELNLNIEKTRLEITFFDKYIKEYPLLKDTILKFKKNSEQQLICLESHIYVLNKIRANV